MFPLVFLDSLLGLKELWGREGTPMVFRVGEIARQFVWSEWFSSGNYGWDKTMSYRVPGIPYANQHFVDFRLSNALEIFEGNVKKFDLPESISVKHATSRD